MSRRETKSDVKKSQAVRITGMSAQPERKLSLSFSSAVDQVLLSDRSRRPKSPLKATYTGEILEERARAATKEVGQPWQKQLEQRQLTELERGRKQRKSQ